jgi:hypothetical protein
MNDERREGRTPGDTLTRAIRAASPEPPFGAVDWDALHGRIMVQAPGILARSTIRRSWWDVAAAWAARGIPIAAASAAAAALALAFGGIPTPSRLAEYEALAALPTTLEAELAADASPFVDHDAEDAIAWALLSFEGEEP